MTFLQQQLDKINPTVTLSSESFVYDGTAKTPDVSIVTNLPYTGSDGGNYDGAEVTLEAGKDFTVTYSDNVNAGTATVTIQGIGNFTGTVTKTFTITKAENAPYMPGSTLSVPYSNNIVSAVTLPTDWVWQDADKNIALEVEKATNATAIYTGVDKSNYENESVTIAITRSKCEHAETELRNAKAETCTELGYTGDTYCLVCETTIKYGSEIEEKGHDIVTDEAKVPTCTETGLTEGQHCSRCENATVEQEVVPALNHALVSHAGKAATCTEKGYYPYNTCSRCDYTTFKEDAAKGHTSVNGGTEKAHTICDVCEEILSAEHEFASKITTEPTYTKEGIKTFTCECGYSYEEVIPCLVPGEIKAEEAESNSFSATVVDINSIVTKLQLTEDEKALIEQGADMKIVFKLSDIGATINTPEKEAIFKALTNEKIAVFLDIQLVKQIANNSVNVQKLNDLIKVTVELPSEFINKDGNVKRSYSVLRYHDGDETKVTTLNAKFDETTGTLTFETDRFSTYAIVYSDVVVSDGEGVPGTPDPGDGEVSTPENPKDETTPGTPETPKDETTPGTPETPKDETTPGTPETPKDEITPDTPETPKDNVSNDKNDDSVTNDKNDASSETGTNDKNDTSKDDVPKAGVISTTSIWLGAMALSGLGALLVSKKKKEND